jgi:hypothetical protein
MRTLALLLGSAVSLAAQTFPGPVGSPTTTAIPHDSPLFVGWATGVASLQRGWVDIRDQSLGTVDYGTTDDALGPAGTSPTDGVVSLGDGGRITLTFGQPIRDGAGFDFAVFENSITDTFLELAFVEVSSNGVDFFRFPAVSNTPTTSQVLSFDNLDTTSINNLAGKYRVGFGTPFDISEIPANPLFNPFAVTHVRIIDVVGSINPDYGTLDSLGNLINDPFPTPFVNPNRIGGFDLDAVGVLNAVPEPSAYAAFLAAGALVLVLRRRARS